MELTWARRTAAAGRVSRGSGTGTGMLALVPQLPGGLLAWCYVRVTPCRAVPCHAAPLGPAVLQEAVSTRDLELVQLVLRYRDYQRAIKRLAGIPILLEKLRKVPAPDGAGGLWGGRTTAGLLPTLCVPTGRPRTSTWR